MTKRKTDTEFKKEVFDLVGDEYTFLDTYVKSQTKLRVKHNKCGHIYEVIPNNFLKGSRCPYCAGLDKKTNSNFKKEIYNLVGDEYIFLDAYVNAKTKLRIKHTICGSVYKAEPDSFLRGNRCPYCSRNTKKTNAQFKQEVYDLVENEYIFLDPYVNAKTKLKVRHNTCGNIYEVRPSDFLRGQRCPYCFGKPKKSDFQFKQEVFDLAKDEYTFLDKYINSRTKLRVKHNKCGHIYKVEPNSFLQGTRCSYCAGLAKKTDTQFKQEVSNLVGDEYVFLDTYVNAITKLRVKHTKCGHVYKVRPTDFFSHRSRCPYCSSPKGEDLINKILKLLGIKYEYQKTFLDLRDTQPLSYDFYIPSQNILIEYQGQQHYKPVDIFGGEAQFKVQKKHDKMKADYAKSHNFNLIAVPYTEDTLSKIKKYLLTHGLSK